MALRTAMPPTATGADADRSPTNVPTRWLWLPALGVAALELLAAAAGPYERFHDEFYYWVGSRRPMLGYVDHPPLAPWLLALSTRLFGDGLLGLGLVPALCGSATVWLTGAMAHRLGAHAGGQLLACLAAACAPVFLVFFSFYSVNAIEIALWTGFCFVAMEKIRTGDERLWWAVGAIAGLALLNKHTFLLLAGALAVGALATPLRAELRSRSLLGGAALALAIAAPNLVWNALHDWPSWAFYTSRAEGNLETTFVDALLIQIAAIGPLAILLWVPGGVLLLASPRLRPYRALGIAFALLLCVILLSGQRRGDRIAGIYPLAFAAGGLFWERFGGRLGRALRGALATLLVGVGALLAAATLPIAAPETVAGIFRAIGESPEIEAADEGQAIPLYLTGRLGWERFARTTLGAWDALPVEQRDRSVILAPHWLYASVIEYYGRGRSLPPVVSPHNAYAFWREDAAGRDVVVAIAVAPEALRRHFEQVTEIGAFRCQHCSVFRFDTPILLAEQPARPLVELLEEWQSYGALPAPALVAGWSR